ncbi:MAG: hypothetical protein AB7O67_20600 [Vicinamibacterales bacterium]
MRDIPPLARAYVTAVIALGVLVFWLALPPVFTEPGLFLVLLFAAVTGSTLKVRLPLPSGGLTLSVSFVAIFMGVLMLDRGAALLIAAASAWTQCTFRPQENYPIYRAFFSMAAMVLAADLAGRTFVALTGGVIVPDAGLLLAVPIAGAVFFTVNSLVVSLAVSLATDLAFKRVWLDGLLWAATAYVLEAGAAAVMAILVVQNGLMLAPLLVAPFYLNYQALRSRVAVMTAAA